MKTRTAFLFILIFFRLCFVSAALLISGNTSSTVQTWPYIVTSSPSQDELKELDYSQLPTWDYVLKYQDVLNRLRSLEDHSPAETKPSASGVYDIKESNQEQAQNIIKKKESGEKKTEKEGKRGIQWPLAYPFPLMRQSQKHALHVKEHHNLMRLWKQHPSLLSTPLDLYLMNDTKTTEDTFEWPVKS